MKIHELRSELTKVQNRAAQAANSASQASEDANFHISNLSSQVHHHQERNDALRKTLRALKAQCVRTPQILKCAVHKASRRPNVIKLTKHGVFTPEA
jgi:hypothetical protein